MMMSSGRPNPANGGPVSRWPLRGRDQRRSAQRQLRIDPPREEGVAVGQVRRGDRLIARLRETCRDRHPLTAVPDDTRVVRRIAKMSQSVAMTSVQGVDEVLLERS